MLYVTYIFYFALVTSPISYACTVYVTTHSCMHYHCSCSHSPVPCSQICTVYACAAGESL